MDRGGEAKESDAVSDRATDTGKAAGIACENTAMREESNDGETVPEEIGAARLARGIEGFNLNSSNILNLKSSPFNSLKLQNTSHVYPTRPPKSIKYKNRPQPIPKIQKAPHKSEKLVLNPLFNCKNRFEVWGDLYIACSMSDMTLKDEHWIFDCCATDTLSFDRSDFSEITKPKKKYVHATNGELALVEGACSIKISPTLKLNNCLYVSTFANNYYQSVM